MEAASIVAVLESELNSTQRTGAVRLKMRQKPTEILLSGIEFI